MIARVWRGIVAESRADEYFAYLKKTGLKEYRSTEGNQGVYVFRRLKDGRAEFLLKSLWESFDVIRRFAGKHYEKAKYYPEDKEFLPRNGT